MDTTDFIKARNKALIAVDEDWFYALCPQMSREAVLPMIHKIRYEVTSMPAHLRHESRKWLEDNGYSRYKGQHWPPPGVLDE